jgi:hypothetical protein
MAAVLSAVLFDGAAGICALLMLLPSFSVGFGNRCASAFTSSNGGAELIYGSKITRGVCCKLVDKMCFRSAGDFVTASSLGFAPYSFEYF